MTDETRKLISKKERQQIQDASFEYFQTLPGYHQGKTVDISWINAYEAGAAKLAELRNAEKPSEELVKEIYDLIEKYHYDEYAIWSVEDSMRCSTEIANIFTQKEAELLEAAKDALTTFYGIGCTDEADIVQALKKAISNYKIH